MNTLFDVRLSVDALLGKAMEETRLSDWGDESFVEALRILVSSFVEESRAHDVGRYLFGNTMLRLLANRLKIERDFKTCPEIRDVDIRRPLVVLGMPRTGTTLLHNLLACDPNARAIPLWQGLYPSPPPDPAALHRDVRIAEAAGYVAENEWFAPELLVIHRLDPLGVEECAWLFEHTFTDSIFELRAHMPAYSKWLRAHESDISTYAYHRSLLQLLAWRCPGEHWVLKAPRHLFGLDGLLAVYPDACIVQTHRDPLKVLPSLCSLTRVNRKMFTDDVDNARLGRSLTMKLRHGLTKAGKRRATSPADQFLDVRYTDLVRDPIAVVRGIYEHHNYPYSDTFDVHMRQWLDDHSQRKEGAHRYALEEYGLDAEEVNRQFADYRDEFDIIQENA